MARKLLAGLFLLILISMPLTVWMASKYLEYNVVHVFNETKQVVYLVYDPYPQKYEAKVWKVESGQNRKAWFIGRAESSVKVCLSETQTSCSQNFGYYTNSVGFEDCMIVRGIDDIETCN